MTKKHPLGPFRPPEPPSELKARALARGGGAAGYHIRSASPACLRTLGLGLGRRSVAAGPGSCAARPCFAQTRPARDGRQAGLHAGCGSCGPGHYQPNDERAAFADAA